MPEMKHTPGPWEYVPSTEHHGPYVMNAWGAGFICDCYTMTNITAPSVRNGGDSRPLHFQGDEADANARLIAAAPEMYEALRQIAEIEREADSVGAASRGMDRVGDVARAALARAEGRQP